MSASRLQRMVMSNGDSALPPVRISREMDEQDEWKDARSWLSKMIFAEPAQTQTEKPVDNTYFGVETPAAMRRRPFDVGSSASASSLGSPFMRDKKTTYSPKTALSPLPPRAQPQVDKEHSPAYMTSTHTMLTRTSALFTLLICLLLFVSYRFSGGEQSDKAVSAADFHDPLNASTSEAAISMEDLTKVYGMQKTRLQYELEMRRLRNLLGGDPRGYGAAVLKGEGKGYQIHKALKAQRPIVNNVCQGVLEALKEKPDEQTLGHIIVVLDTLWRHANDIFDSFEVSLNDFDAWTSHNELARERMVQQAAGVHRGSFQDKKVIADLEKQVDKLNDHIHDLKGEILKEQLTIKRLNDRSADNDVVMGLEQEVHEAEVLQRRMADSVLVVRTENLSLTRHNELLAKQIAELQSQHSRDMRSVTYTSGSISVMKIQCAWFRTLVRARRAPRDMKDAASQIGDSVGLGPNVYPKVRTLPKNPMSVGNFWYDILRASLRGIANLEAEARTQHQGAALRRREDFAVIGLSDLEMVIEGTWGDMVLLDEGRTGRYCCSSTSVGDVLFLRCMEEQKRDPHRAKTALIAICIAAYQHSKTSQRANLFWQMLNSNVITNDGLPLDCVAMLKDVLLHVRRGETPLLPKKDKQRPFTRPQLEHIVEYVFTGLKVSRKMVIVTELDELISKCGRTGVLIDSLLLWLAEAWCREKRYSENALFDLFNSADSDRDGFLYHEEVTALFEKHFLHPNIGVVAARRALAELQLIDPVDQASFMHIVAQHGLFGMALGQKTHGASWGGDSDEVFKVVTENWMSQQQVLHEILLLMQGTVVGERVERHLATFERHLEERTNPDATVHCYKTLMEDFRCFIANRVAADTGDGTEPDPETISASMLRPVALPEDAFATLMAATED